MTRYATAVFVLTLLAGCGAGEPSPASDANGSVLVHQIHPIRGRLDDIVVAYGQATAGPGGARVLTLPVDGVVVSVEVVPGQRVRAGQRLAHVEPAPAARSSATQARTSLALAAEQHDRTRRLLASRLASNEQMAQAEKALVDARAIVDAQTIPAWIVAPADGTVGAVDAARGALVMAGSPVMSFSENTQVSFVGGIEPIDMPRVHIGYAVVLTPLSGGDSIDAKVNAVGGAVNATTRLIDVGIQPASVLVPGMSYRASIVVGTREGWLVPADAVVGDDGARKVWQVQSGEAHGVPVSVVGGRGTRLLVAGDIDAGHPLVTTGAPQLGEGMQVRPEAGR